MPTSLQHFKETFQENLVRKCRVYDPALKITNYESIPGLIEALRSNRNDEDYWESTRLYHFIYVNDRIMCAATFEEMFNTLRALHREFASIYYNHSVELRTKHASGLIVHLLYNALENLVESEMCEETVRLAARSYIGEFFKDRRYTAAVLPSLMSFLTRNNSAKLAAPGAATSPAKEVASLKLNRK